MMDHFEELKALMLRHAAGLRTVSDIPHVAIIKADTTTGPLPGFYDPILCFVVQGAKRLIIGDQTLLRQLGGARSRLSVIRRVLCWIRDNYTEPFQIEDLAAMSGMSLSVFHRHFKAVTAMSPIQFQKHIRLYEARRRLFAGAGNAATVAFSVGYESASQFSREYARLFGAPPTHDIDQLRCAVNVQGVDLS
jgi:AraC-like DNA-binding protein